MSLHVGDPERERRNALVLFERAKDAFDGDSQKSRTTVCVHQTCSSLLLTNDPYRMSQKTSAFEPAIRRLERQAAESIDEDTDLLTVVREFDLSTAEVYKASETEWNARYSYEPMVRAFYCKELAGFTTEELHEYLADAETGQETTEDEDESTDERTPRLGEEYGIEVNDTVFMVITSVLYLLLGWAAGFLFVTLLFVLLSTLWFRIPWYIGIGLGVLATVVIWFFMTFLILPFDQGTIFDFSPFFSVCDRSNVDHGRTGGRNESDLGGG